MKLGMFTSGYQRMELEDIFRDARDYGYDYIELWGGRPHGYPPDLKSGQLKEIRKLIKEYDMPVEIYTPELNAYPYNFILGDRIMREEALNHLKLSMDMGRELGAHYTVISAGHAGYRTCKEEIWSRLSYAVKELSLYAKSIDHCILIENLTPQESNVCTTAEELKKIVDQIGSPYFKCMLDLVPPFIQGEKILDYFNLLGDDIRHLHVVDSDGLTESHLIPGEGLMPFKKILKEVKDFGYRGRATIELVSNYLDRPSEAAKLSIDNLKSLME